MPSSENSAKKSMDDVSKPGKTAADASARPVIVTHRPIVQDPMMKQDADVSIMEPAKPVKESNDSPTSGERVIKPLESDDSTKPDDVKTKQESVETAHDDNDGSYKDNQETAVVDAVVDQVADDKRKKHDADDQTAAKQAHFQKLIDDKKYFVKTGQVARRRNNRIALALFIFILITVGLYLAVDAKLIDPGFDVPYQVIQN